MACLVSCNGDTNAGKGKSGSITYPQSYYDAEEKLDKQPGKASAQLFSNELRKLIPTITNRAEQETLLVKGLSVSERYKMGPNAIGFLMPLVKDFPENTNSEEYLAKLASVLQDVGKSIPGDILAQAYEKKYPKGKFTNTLKAKVKEDIGEIEPYLMAMAEKVFENPDKFGINKLNAQKYVDACEAFAFGYPNAEKAPVFLFRAAEMARTLKTFPKALNLYDWISSKYPNYEKSATTLFLKGFMLENELNNKEEAKKVYREFLSKYPGHDLEDDIKFLLENIDKSNEEIIKIIDQAKSNEK